MSDLSERFEQAQADVQGLAKRPSNDDLLALYANYKQATVGDASDANKPGRFDFVGQAKYHAWASRSGATADDAMQAYVELADRLLGR